MFNIKVNYKGYFRTRNYKKQVLTVVVTTFGLWNFELIGKLFLKWVNEGVGKTKMGWIREGVKDLLEGHWVKRINYNRQIQNLETMKIQLKFEEYIFHVIEILNKSWIERVEKIK